MEITGGRSSEEIRASDRRKSFGTMQGLCWSDVCQEAENNFRLKNAESRGFCLFGEI